MAEKKAAAAKKPAAKKSEARTPEQVRCVNCTFHTYVAAANFHTCTRWNRILEADEVETGYCHRAVAGK